jgi:hypothetical protein
VELTVKINYAPGDYGDLLRVFLSEDAAGPDIDRTPVKKIIEIEAADAEKTEWKVALDELEPATAYYVKVVLRHFDADWLDGTFVSK